MAKAFLVLLCALGIVAIKADDTCDEGELANVQMLQTKKAKVEPVENVTYWSGISHFLDNDGVLCAEGEADDAEGALALKKAGVHGAMFDKVHAKKGSCHENGFKYTEAGYTALDDCYPGITLSYKNKKGATKFQKAQDAALANFAETYNIGLNKAKHLYDCTCHKNSVRREESSMVCPEALQALNGSFLHYDTEDNTTGLVCVEGPFYYATMHLAILKSTQLLAMHHHDHVALESCSSRGFSYAAAFDDPCFVGMHYWTATSNFTSDWGRSRFKTETDILTAPISVTGVDWNWNELFKLPVNEKVMARTWGCHCTPHSALLKEQEDMKCGAGSSSPIRDWLED